VKPTITVLSPFRHTAVGSLSPLWFGSLGFVVFSGRHAALCQLLDLPKRESQIIHQVRMIALGAMPDGKFAGFAINAEFGPLMLAVLDIGVQLGGDFLGITFLQHSAP
jgi:hypothetical protein